MRPKLSAALLCLALVGCAGKQVIPAPNEHRVEAEAALRAAEESGASRVPEAARHLEFARQQIADAQRLMVEGEEDAAELRFRQAASDADLALALARSVPIQQEARRTTEQAEALRRGQP
jgi:small ligand-binding sensory domain FIST